MVIALKDYKQSTDDLEPGNSLRVNHTACPAGEDTRRRLYLTRPLANPEVIIGYCHNCQDQGYAKANGWEAYRDKLHVQSTPLKVNQVMKNFDQPSNMVEDLMNWPTHAQAWAYKGKLDSVLVPKFGIAYDVSSDRVYLPRFVSVTHQFTHALQAYQLRNTIPNRDMPKYLTVCSDKDNGYTIMYSLDRPGGDVYSKDTLVLVIVEDYLSGIAIIEAYGSNTAPSVHVIVNYGTKVSLEALHKAAQYSHVLVWLDNDNGHVIDQAETMARTIRLMSAETKVFVDVVRSDPKHYTSEDIRDQIDTWSWGV